jgi:tRNA(Arg) A34 adenosine deaminase TadA
MSRVHVLKASVFDKKGRLIASATNQYKKSHPIQAHFAKLAGLPERQYLHAEIAALLRCKTKQPYSIHVERYKRNGSPALAAPCPVCLQAIKAWKVQQITYTEDQDES